MRGERSLLFNRQIRLMMTEDLNRAVHAAATKDLVSMSEYCRVVVDRGGVVTGTTSTQSGAGAGANLAAGSNAANRPYETVK